MRIEIIEKNCKASDKLRDIIDKKVSKLNKFFDDKAVCKVCLTEEKKSSRTEITIFYNGNIVRAEVSGENFYDNIDDALPKIEKQIYKHKSKIASKLKQDAFKEQADYDYSDDDLKLSKVVKIKNFELLPMSVEDAIAEMELLEHSFYVFLEKDSDDIRVIYRRNSGDVGMLVPIIAKL